MMMVCLFTTTELGCFNLTRKATVISIQENPFPQAATPNSKTHTPEEKAKTLEIIRRNAGIIFLGISNAPRAKKVTANSLMATRVRQFANKEKKSGTNPNECASLLFYAVFDDWLTIYNVVAKREHPYGAALGVLVSYLYAVHFNGDAEPDWVIEGQHAPESPT